MFSDAAVIKNTVMATDGAQQARQEFLGQMREQMSKMLSATVEGKFESVVFTPGFNFQTTVGPNAYFNKNTLRKIDYTIMKDSNGNPTLNTGRRFSDFYRQVIEGTVFALSKADQKIVADETTKLSSKESSLILSFEQRFGTIKLGDSAPTKLDYILDYIRDKFSNDMDLLAERAPEVQGSYSAWRTAFDGSAAIYRRQREATARLQAMIKNLKSPSQANGGVQVATDLFEVGYVDIPPASKLVGALKEENNAVRIQCSVSHKDETSQTFSIGGSAGFTVPFEFITLQVGGSMKFDLSHLTQHAQSIDIDFLFQGVTSISPSPRTLSSDYKAGWYDQLVLEELQPNLGKTDVSGYRLMLEEFAGKKVFGEGALLSRARTLVLSQMPLVKMTFRRADTTALKTQFKENMKVGLSLGGIFELGSIDQSYSISHMSEDSANGTITITLGTPGLSGGIVPAEDETCFVMGAVVSYPPAN